ncbi:MAG: glycerol-3-phosphate dehydrogenase/oxidase [Syntrophales bacterium]|jgi:glycerol-3-phosphate dehydrogenase
MWTQGWRDRVWNRLGWKWDIIVIGGGITGAGILRIAAQLGLKVLLVERNDFGWGTSSRSSKLVHGGMRYLKEGKIFLTRDSVREREKLIKEGPGLIAKLNFLLACYKDEKPGKYTYKAGLALYDLLGSTESFQQYTADDFHMLTPYICAEGLGDGFSFYDAQTDDARLVLRVILEAVAGGASAINYTAAEELLFKDKKVEGIRIRDLVEERTSEVYAKVVISATSVWADELRVQLGAKPRMRPLRGSHILFPAWRLPTSSAITFPHPADRRPVFIFPWEGATLVGTTDLDHDHPLEDEPQISSDEVSYLMAAVESKFPLLKLTLADVIATYAGLRPVIGTGKADPSKESRDHVIWDEKGLITVTGGKLTTFRLIAIDTLMAAAGRLPGMREPNKKIPVLDRIDKKEARKLPVSEEQRVRLIGRYGINASELIAVAKPVELEPIPNTKYLWAELRWAARSEGVVHLGDLLLRRVRLGLLLPEGGKALLPMIRTMCQSELGWDDDRWKEEEAAYLELWRKNYSLPDRKTIADWHEMSVKKKTKR